MALAQQQPQLKESDMEVIGGAIKYIELNNFGSSWHQQLQDVLIFLMFWVDETWSRVGGEQKIWYEQELEYQSGYGVTLYLYQQMFIQAWISLFTSINLSTVYFQYF